jgi:hypothetical protein
MFISLVEFSSQCLNLAFQLVDYFVARVIVDYGFVVDVGSFGGVG